MIIANGLQIGAVVARMGDAENSDGRLTGSRGYTVIYLYKWFALQPYFTKTGCVEEGERVTKYGSRSEQTNGTILEVEDNTERPDLALLRSDVVQLPGDSGSPWYTSGPTLIGVDSSGDQQNGGGGAGSQAQPIEAVTQLIRQHAGRWGSGFHVWVEQ